MDMHEQETKRHIRKVNNFLKEIIDELSARGKLHDRSKLSTAEAPYFEEVISELSGLTYGSPEYAACLGKLKPALDHHYEFNRHHPEHFKDGISGMNLIDVVEMIADWKAASLRHADGDIMKSIECNQKRFNYSDDLKKILQNTIQYLGWDERHYGKDKRIR